MRARLLAVATNRGRTTRLRRMLVVGPLLLLAACPHSEQPPGDAAGETSHVGDGLVIRQDLNPLGDTSSADGPIDPGSAIAIDGLFEDWAGIPPRRLDPVGDALGPFDLAQVYAVSRGTTVYLRFSHGAPKNLGSGPAGESSLAITLALKGGASLSIDLRTRTIKKDGANPQALSWSAVSYRAMPTVAAGETELAVDLAAIGATLGSEVAISFTGSDQLAAPIALRLTHPPQQVEAISTTRSPSSTFRLLSLNTLGNGLGDSTRIPAFSRLFAALAPDIVCLQEERFTTTAQITASLPPLPDSAPWHVQRSSVADVAIASRWPMSPLPQGTRFVAAGIDLPSGKTLVVYSFHTSCCGYIGSPEDGQRIAQAQEIADSIAQLRRARLGPALERFAAAPIIVAGDWNLVGSDAPLALLEAAEGPALPHWLLRHLTTNDVYTWRADSSRFPPGLLDLVLYDDSRLAADKGFIFDSHALSEASLRQLGLLATDSEATDHLALVCEFRLQ